MTTNNKNQIQAFGFGDALVRTVTINGESWFVARDVCSCLDLDDVSKAVERLAEDEKGTNSIRTPGGEQVVLVISEAGLYRLIFTSRKAEAETFRRITPHRISEITAELPGLGEASAQAVPPPQNPFAPSRGWYSPCLLWTAALSAAWRYPR